MDYYRIRNIQADTKMRTSFSTTVTDHPAFDDGDN